MNIFGSGLSDIIADGEPDGLHCSPSQFAALFHAMNQVCGRDLWLVSREFVDQVRTICRRWRRRHRQARYRRGLQTVRPRHRGP